MNLKTMSYDELIKHAEEVLVAVRHRAYSEGYGQGRFDERMDSVNSGEPTPNENTRDSIIEKAKRDVDKIIERGKDINAIDGDEGNETYRESFYNVELVVNREKRTVVALVSGATSDGRVFYVRHRGIAKCDPSDCFNVHIGKAIALRRALGLEVPTEYLNAPAPTEVRVGDVVWLNRVECAYLPNGSEEISDITDQIKRGIAKIIDDSRE